jgi:hypothetical protein
MWDKRAEHLKTVDGNTVKMVLDQGFGDTKLVTVRLLGIYTQEPKCKEFVDDWFDKHRSAARWAYIVTTTQLDSGEFVVSITDIGINSNLNAELAEFIHVNGYK